MHKVTGCIQSVDEGRPGDYHAAMEESSATTPRVPTTLEQRLALIDSYLFWFGSLNRALLVEQLGFSSAQASLDIAEYRRRRPHNLTYDTSRRTYRAAPAMQPLYEPLSPHQLLYTMAINDRGQPWAFWPWLPTVAAVSAPNRSIDVAVHREVLRALRDGLDLTMFYQSLEQPEPRVRRIAPHAIGYDGMRFHLRAYCFSNEDYRDFVLSRIISVRSAAPLASELPADRAWDELVELVLVPHPAFTAAQREVIESEFGMSSGRLAVSCRRALAQYFVRYLRLESSDPSKAKIGQELYWANREDLKDIEGLS